MVEGDAYLSPEDRARIQIDEMLDAAGWAVQAASSVNLAAAQGVAVREFVLAPPHGRVDYLLFVDQAAVGVIEAKKAGSTLTGVEWQTAKYLDGVPAAIPTALRPLPFAYESTGYETRFTNVLDPDAASRQVFWFHRPEMLAEWVRLAETNPDHPTLRARFRAMPEVDLSGLWPPKDEAVRNLDKSLAEGRSRALIQMATGSGKTLLAAFASYRLVKHAGARRVLFLVDRANLGRQTLREFQAFITPDDGRKFTELYNVQHLSSNVIDPVARVTITTIQRLYSILKGERELDAEADEHSTYDLLPTAPVPVAYNPDVPIETFDVIIVDECHRSIFGLWRQILDYFDAFIVGLTATPNKQAFGFFNQNLIMEYTHDEAVADGVNVDFDVYRIETEITKHGSKIDAGLVTSFRDRQTRQVRWEQLDDDLQYSQTDLDRAVVAKDQIRTVIRTFKDRLFTEIFPGRTDVPKTLVFAKDDSHADDIVQILKEEFGKGNEFCVKITYKSTGKKPDEMISEFRNSYYPRIAVTVDMIATGTDVRPLECVFFMRAVRSRTYFEQMKGRGVRVINDADFQAVTPDAKAKIRFVIVDAVGVTESAVDDTQPLDRKPRVALDLLLKQVSFGNKDPDLISTIASRLARLDRQLSEADRRELRDAADGLGLTELTHALVEALDLDRQYEVAQAATGNEQPTAEEVSETAEAMLGAAVAPLATNPTLRGKILEVRRSYEQTIDETSTDTVIDAGYSADATERARHTIDSFRQFIEDHRDEITALQVLYDRAYRQRLTFKEIKELANAIGRPPHIWTPERLWQAYETLDRTKVRGSGGHTLTDMVSLVRYALHQDDELVPFPEQVNERFAGWLLAQEQAGRHFTDEQLAWLTRIRDHISAAIAITPDDFEYVPFIEHGGLGKATEVFGDQLDPLLADLNQQLVA
jgi:type I restriction enzyme, R subunit